MALGKAVTSVPNGSTSPYTLDVDQTLKASKALLAHLRSETRKIAASSQKKSLAATDDSGDEEDVLDDVTPIWLNLATKQHIADKNKLKPSKIAVPHTLNRSGNISICLISTDPQRAAKNIIADETFPSGLASKITTIIGVSKLTLRYKTFESRRQLLSQHDVFLADDRIITRLPKLLGKVFYKGTAKRPIPISIAPRKSESEKAVKGSTGRKDDKEAAVASPSIVAAEIERALTCVPVSVKPGTNVSIRIGLEAFTPQQLAENVQAVVPKLIEKHVVKGWKNVKSINIKSPDSIAVPIWLSDDLWTGDTDVMSIDDETQAKIEASSTEPKKRKRNPATTKGPQTGQRKKARVDVEKVNGEQRKQRLASLKATAFDTV